MKYYIADMETSGGHIRAEGAIEVGELGDLRDKHELGHDGLLN